MRPPSRPTRRTVLLLGATAAGSACTRGAPRPGATPPPPVDPDDALRDAAAARERSLLQEYDVVLLALPELAARLLPLRAHHAEHLVALVGPPPPGADRADADPAGAAPAGADPTGSSSAAPATPAVPPPADAAAALTRLRGAEHAAGDGHAQDCLLASRELAPVLASLSASEHSHPVALA